MPITLTRRLLGAIIAVAALPLAARAQIDVNGTFWVEAFLPSPDALDQVTFTQVGSTLTMSGGLTGSGTGTIDTATGAFFVATPGGPCFGVAGTATNGGADFTATYTGGTILFCNFSVLVLAGSRHCHDGVVDAAAGEECDPGAAIDRCCVSCRKAPVGATCQDDGNDCTRDECNAAAVCVHPNGLAGSFCASDSNACTIDKCDGAGTCRHPPDTGAFCTSDSDQCTRDVCDEVGQCTHPVAVGVACDDGDVCTTDDTCNFDGICQPGAACIPCGTCLPDSGCPFFPPADDGCDQPIEPGSPLRLKPGSSDERNAASWKLTHGPATPPSAFGDPVAATSYTLCAYTRPSTITLPFYSEVLWSAVLPAGGTCGDEEPCWKASKDGYCYRDRAGRRGGITRLDLRAGDAGRTRLSVKAKGAALDLPALPIDGPVLVRLIADNGRCWQAEYLEKRKNDESVFRADGAAHVQP